MHLRASTPEPSDPQLPDLIVVADRPTRSRKRRWLIPALLISLVLHLLAGLVVVLWPPAPPGQLDADQAASPRQMAFELTPTVESAAPPPAATATTAPPPTPPPAAPAPPPIPATPPVPPVPQVQPQPPTPEPPLPAPPPSPDATLPAPPPQPPMPIPQPTPPPRPARPAPRPQTPPPPKSSDYFFAPNALQPGRQAQGQSHNPVELSVGRVENYIAAPPRRNPNDEDSDIQVSGAQVGSDWMHELHGWWIEHRRYPQQAIRNDESGTVVIRFKVDRSGHTSGAELISRSGSQWLDAQAMATFNNAHLPPFPSNTPENEATLTLTINYQLVHQ